MKTYLVIAAILTTSLATTNLTMAGPGGGGGAHFGGGGMHGGSGGHFSMPARGGHFDRRGSDSGGHHDFDRGRHGFRGGFWGGYWPYYGGGGYPESEYGDSTVAAVQDALAREGYYHGPVSGYFNPATQDAIARYEADYHLPITSAIDQSLLNSLGLD